MTEEEKKISDELDEVNRSNFSKLEVGKPVFQKGGKIGKGKDYTEPDLKKLVL